MRLSALTGVRGAILVAIVYIYFLIFAQFAFLARLAALGITGDWLRVVMAAMAAGGILFSLAAPRVDQLAEPAGRLRIGLVTCAAAALLCLLPLNRACAAAVAFAFGGALGLVTVTLVTHLRAWTGDRHGILFAGIGTGAGYFVCNIPAVFTSSPEHQAVLAAGLCCMALLFTGSLRSESAETRATPASTVPFLVALASFTALVWLDSAAFFIIQHSAALKAGTWLGSAHLWTNAWLHAAAAGAAAMLLSRSRVLVVLAGAFGCLAFACILLDRNSGMLSASVFYPVGVSLYSVALVAYPSFLSPARTVAQRGRQAGSIYAVAGWIGSALGIGMGQNLGHIPVAFVAAAGAVVLAFPMLTLLRTRPRELALLCIMLAVAGVFQTIQLGRRPARPESSVERGRQLYISEGCISCHSQYVRPNSPDVLMWGPVESMQQIHEQKPPLIGNRRQGPDLSAVGVRRSTFWLKAHLLDPSALSYHSVMPSYAFLFHDQRGDDLVAYLESLTGVPSPQHAAELQSWQPSPQSWRDANPAEGETLYREHCATCHEADGAARKQWPGALNSFPSGVDALREAARRHSDSELARIAKFGIPHTNMPGHEYLNDRQIASLTIWLAHARAQPRNHP